MIDRLDKEKKGQVTTTTTTEEQRLITDTNRNNDYDKLVSEEEAAGPNFQPSTRYNEAVVVLDEEELPPKSRSRERGKIKEKVHKVKHKLSVLSSMSKTPQSLDGQEDESHSFSREDE